MEDSTRKPRRHPLQTAENAKNLVHQVSLLEITCREEPQIKGEFSVKEKSLLSREYLGLLREI